MSPGGDEREWADGRARAGERPRAAGDQQRDAIIVEALPAIARLAAVAWLRSASWGLQTSLRVGGRLAHAASDPGSAAQLAEDVSSGLRSYAREFLGISDLDNRVKQLTPASGVRGRGHRRNGPTQELTLRAQGAELLRQAADVNYEEGAHPAYARILLELAPDEGRILRLLAVDGAQPSVDVRAANLIGIGSQLVAPGLNMIGAQAGVRHRDRVPAYLNNLYRLGLIWFAHEPLEDPIKYQVLEAQPDVLHAIKETTRAKIVQRSIHLTPFGQDFCEICLPLDTAEMEALTAGED
jgi:Abortive infection alpha